MSKHEIRLRRQKLTATGAERYRNYGAVMERHEKDMRLKKVLRVFSMLFIIMIVVMLIIIVTRLERKTEEKKIETSQLQISPKGALRTGSWSRI